MIENHQKMQEMSRRVENWINDAEMEIHTETFSDEEEDWGNSPPTPHPSADWDAETDNPPFYIPIRRTITVEQWECGALHVVTAKSDASAPKLCVCGNLTTKLALFRAIHV